MANDGKTTSVAFIGIVLGSVLVYVIYRLMMLEKQLREVKASQSTHIQELIQEHIESALASALLEEVPTAAAELKPAVTMRIPMATAIHEVFNSGDISQFIHTVPVARPPPPAKSSKMTVEEVVEEPAVVTKAPPPVVEPAPPKPAEPVVVVKQPEPVKPADKPVEPEPVKPADKPEAKPEVVDKPAAAAQEQPSPP